MLVGEGPASGAALEYVRPAGVASASISTFAALAVDPGVADVTLRDAAAPGDRWLVVELTGELTDIVRLKPLLPVGTPAQWSAGAGGGTVRFTIADRLVADAIDDSSGDVDVDALADAWNASP